MKGGTHEMATTDTSLTDCAAAIRADVSTDAAELAKADQHRAEWVDAFATLGLNLDEHAVGAFAMAQLLLFHLVDTDGDLEQFGERLIEGATSAAWSIS